MGGTGTAGGGTRTRRRPDHDFGSDVAIIQVFATHASFGVLAVLALRAWCGHPVSVGVRRRMAMVGVVAIPTIIVTDLVLASFLLAGTGLFNALTSWFIVARWVCLGVLIVVGVASMGGVFGRRAESAGLCSDWITTALPLTALAIAGWIAVGVAINHIPTRSISFPPASRRTFWASTSTPCLLPQCCSGTGGQTCWCWRSHPPQ